MSRLPRTGVPGRLSLLERGAIAAVTVALFGAAWLSGGSAEPPRQTASVSVEAGDTLWSLAAQHRVKGLTTAETVRVLRELNHLDQTALLAGDVISVPAETGFDTGSALAMH